MTAGTWHRAAPLLATLLAAAPLAAQEAIGLDDVRENINRFVTVEAKVARVFRSGSETWVALGRAYPGSPLVIVLSSATARAVPALQSYRNKTVRVTGRIEPPAQEAPPGRTRAPGEAAPGRRPSKPYIVLEDPSMLLLLDSGG